MADPAWLVGKQAALAVRLELDAGFAPLNIWDVLRRRGCRTALHEFGSTGGDGVYLWDAREQAALVVINQSQHAARQRFTAAHELGHHEMHRFAGGDVQIVDKDIYDEKGDSREEAANAFAANLLTPDEALRRELALSGKTQRTLAPVDVVALMARYGLSYEATVNRLNNAHLINRQNRQRLLDESRGQVTRLTEELGYDEAKAFPVGETEQQTVKGGAFELYRDAVISAAVLGDLLDVSPEEALTQAAEHGFARPEELALDEEAAARLLS